MMFKLSSAHLEYLVNRLLSSMNRATRADKNAFDRVEYLRLQYKQHNLTDEHLRAKLKIDYKLLDYLDDYRHGCAEVQRYAAAITALTAADQVAQRLSV